MEVKQAEATLARAKAGAARADLRERVEADRELRAAQRAYARALQSQAEARLDGGDLAEAARRAPELLQGAGISPGAWLAVGRVLLDRWTSLYAEEERYHLRPPAGGR